VVRFSRALPVTFCDVPIHTDRPALSLRKSLEPEVATRAAALLSLSFWTPLFYITTVMPGANSWAGAPEADPRLHGAGVTPNCSSPPRWWRSISRRSP